VNIRSITAPNPGVFTLDGTRSYLLDDFAVLDPGPSIESHIAAILAAVPTLRTIFITHRHGDHAPAAIPLKEATGATIVAPAGVLAETDVIVGDGDFVEGLTAIATPGHTAEHVCYMTPDRDLFTGDTILGTGTTAIFPPDGNMADYLRSLGRLRGLAPRRIFPAHGPTRDDAVALIDEYIAHRLEREQQIVAAMSGGATTARELRAAVYPDLDPRLHGAAEIQIEAHMIKLREEGRALNTRTSSRSTTTAPQRSAKSSSSRAT
jgi:glyoxylase-like metal-dependent hydrolase (beta-lactamase superfamily II)